ncbi:hypothetical protein LJR129_005065 [Acidovorax sp. LjRoot129]|uniref:hypothetical protein n=1 Tax=unclassified Acidovorax TaxID=2684926 RepID=UPI003ECD4D5B
MPCIQTAIQHPCNAWAVSAGLPSWAAALDDMRAGKVLCGMLLAVSPHSKSTLGMQLFLEQVSKEDLHVVVSEMGECVVGLKSTFPAKQVDPTNLNRNPLNEEAEIAEGLQQDAKSAQLQSHLRAHRKLNAGDNLQPKPAPFYRQFDKKF